MAQNQNTKIIIVSYKAFLTDIKLYAARHGQECKNYTNFSKVFSLVDWGKFWRLSEELLTPPYSELIKIRSF